MRKYELTYLVSDQVAEKDLNKVTGAVSGLIADFGGKVDKEDIWGRRKLAYSIKKQDFATYVTLFFSMPAEKAQEFEKDLHLNSSILRHLLIVKEYGNEKISLTKEEIAENEDIEAVIGGEKSFEAVEGMTEESRDLMAKREETEDEVEPEKVENVEKIEVNEKAETPQKKEEVKEPEKIAEEKTEKIKKVKAETKETKVKTPAKELDKKEKTETKKAKTDKASDESERLSKLNDELDDILKDEL